MGAHGDPMLLSVPEDISFACTTAQQVQSISQLHLLLGRQSVLCWEKGRKLEDQCSPSYVEEGGRESLSGEINAKMSATH